MIRRLAATLACTAIIVLPAAAAKRPKVKYRRIEQFERAYQNGLNAYRAGSFEEAAEAMKNAADLHPGEGGQKVVLANRALEEYLPYFWEGSAHYASALREYCPTSEACAADSEFVFPDRALTPVQVTRSAIAKAAFARTDGNEFREAVSAFNRSEAAGYIRSLPQYAQLVAMRAHAEALIRRSDAQRAVAEQVRLASNGHAAKETGAVAAAFDAVAVPLTRWIYEQPETEAPVQAAAMVSADPQQTVREKADIDRQDAMRHLRQRAFLARTLAAYLVVPNAPALPEAASLTSTASAAEALSDNAASGDIAHASQLVDGAIASAERTLAAAGSPASRPSPALIEATALFFAGDYPAVEPLLSSATLRDARESARAMLLRAAAVHAQYRAHGAADAQLLGRAAEAVRQCRRLDPTVTPTGDFSDAFRSFFAATS